MNVDPLPGAAARLASSLADRYRFERELGAGGMATVYLAHDIRHERKVAIKVLRPELAAVIGAERFLREIRTIASLQHPHILGLIDSGEVAGNAYYVMPFVEGESLRDRLQREKQLPIADAVRIATEVASALDYAHRHQIVHRDIKPENILLHDGQALVADFGIALALTTAGGTRMTETGMSLGTPHYMSPEQAMGDREITARSDIYALGAMTYEMLVGEPPFTGPTAQAIIAKVITAEAPRPSEVRKTVPAHVDGATMTALAKLPADRFGSAQEFAAALADPGYVSGTVARAAGVLPGGRRSRLRDPVVLGLGAVAATSLAIAVILFLRPAPGPALGAIRFTFSGSDSARVVGGSPWPAAISPDGTMLAYTVNDPSGRSMLYLRPTDELEGRPIPGTAGASQPLFSPDGWWIAFQVPGLNKKVRLDGSVPLTIAQGVANNGADWTSSDQLVVGATGGAHGLSRVSIVGGDLTPLTHPDSAAGELEHLWPVAHPDGNTVVFAIWSGDLAASQLAVTSLASGKVTRLGLKGIRPLAVVDDALIYVQWDGAVTAVRLDDAGRAAGTPIPVLDPVWVQPANNGNSEVFVSKGGALVTGRENRQTRLMWIDRRGVATPVSSEVRDYDSPRVSPDGRRLAVVVRDGPRGDVWLTELGSGVFSRVTRVENVDAFVWSSDGSEVIYLATREGVGTTVSAQSVAAGTPPRLVADAGTVLARALTLSPDGRTLILQVLGASGWELREIALDSTRGTQEFLPGAQTSDPKFSPDGKWIATVVSEAGVTQVWLRSFPQPTLKIQVSTGQGNMPVWAADGSRLYFRSGDAIVAARLSPTPIMRIVSRDTVATGLRNDGSRASDFDVAPDGSRIVTPVSQAAGYELVVVPNWLTEFRRRFAGGKP